jgi:bacterial/archaeal transporter family-2 protein
LSAGTALAVALAAVAGLAGAVQVAVMSELGERVGVAAALAVSAIVTLVVAVAILLVARDGIANFREAFHIPVWLWVGGALSILIVLAVTVGGARIGSAATIGIIIAGNLVMGAVIDRFGLFGVDRIALTWPRLLGIGLLAVGAALSLHKAD